MCVGYHTAAATVDTVSAGSSAASTVTRAPRSCRVTAAVSPMIPPPTTTTSIRSAIVRSFRSSFGSWPAVRAGVQDGTGRRR
ncbi:hypothetical protein GA0070558_10983 [Micromonospora haikouensis]|uniref:Uncharacterized protein n=1 Tax=Micromonospora haikouensis TaxID=686309 RepID=A0A1C4VIZ3_9ACTN|nr:hypothetical protein GA0070558_10983 [Micromonospora haikouensis]